jgi:hypothetical protein
MDARPRHDLFVSYAEDDRAWVEGYLLPGLGLPVDRVRTHRDFALGQPFVDEYARAVDRSRHTLLVLSPAFAADRWATLVKDLAVFLNAESEQGRLVPLQYQPAELGLELRSLVALDFTDRDGWDDETAKLRNWLGQPPPAPEAIRCPYPGLRAFGEHDRKRFFGREDEARELRARLSKHPFQAVIGPSGSGKSSLVFAGLVPALRTSGLFGPERWMAYTLRPGAEPMKAGTTVIGTDPPESGPTFADLLATPPGKLLLVVDQFEEFYAVAREHSRRQASTSGDAAPPDDELPFQEALLRLTRSPGCHVVLTVRADFYPDLMASPLWPEIQAHRLEVLPLSTDGLRRAIARPAMKAGVHVEAVLVERLVRDAAGEPGALPLVQEALVYLWEELRGRFLGVEAYEALGRQAGTSTENGTVPTGLQVAMARHADVAVAKLSPEQQVIARRMFLRLVQFGEGRADTRRQQSVAKLRSVADDPELFEATLRHLADNRLLTLGAEGRRGRDEH